ncbi:hypothetical protein MCUN1_000094 [Malassezia cuniculi]|uniref:succinate-semialdehyde dehydrogenase [NAD(P)(+)] n=1 Tax=Malassezia cuniculi TaxID=948313 RepID=A0AAF0ER19_9BASI|nr:hypothetical protein MCUN1_000094 [Malassezia cuniculi]
MLGVVATAGTPHGSFVSDDHAESISAEEPGDHVPQVDWPGNKVVLPSLSISYRSRPAAFGPSTSADGIWGKLAPISLISGSDNLACGQDTEVKTHAKPPKDWVALVERGECPFADKVRYAQSLGATAVIVGDARGEPDTDFFFDFPGLALEEDLGLSGGRLLTMRSDEDTSDIVIPSGFVIRPSYLELLGYAQPKGIRVGVFLDHAFDDGEMSDFGLVLLLFPACIMLFIIVYHHVRAAIKRFMDRAPLVAIQRLPCYMWQPDGQWERVAPSAVQARNDRAQPSPARGLDWVIENMYKAGVAAKRSLGFKSLQVEEAVAISQDAPRFVDDSCPICLVEFSEGDILKHATLIRDKSYIGGAWAGAKNGKELTVQNKATLQEIGTVPSQGVADLNDAIDAANAAFGPWSRKTPKERHDILITFYHRLQENAEDLAHLIVAENGKSLTDAKGEVAYGNGYIEWFAEEALRVYGYTTPSPMPHIRNIVQWRPIGPVGIITPWNFPLAMITRKLGAALAAGCTVVIKAPTETPLTPLAVARIAEESGIPPGVINILVTAKGPDEAAVGRAMCESPLLRKISFTGSTRVGRILMEQGASTLKKLSMELGGNAPFIVFDDADVDTAAENAVASKFRGGGQTCVSANRILVQDGIYDAFAEAISEKVRKLRVGNGMDDGVRIGPLVSEAGVDKVSQHVEAMRAAGGQILVGGERGEGLFYAPTVVSTAPGAAIPTDTEETFGPLAALYRFKDEAEALKLANNVDVGLAGYFFSRDVGRCFRVAEALHVGMVGINTGLISQTTIPFGGVNQSGFGREGGPTGIHEYMYEQALIFGDIQ